MYRLAHLVCLTALASIIISGCGRSSSSAKDDEAKFTRPPVSAYATTSKPSTSTQSEDVQFADPIAAALEGKYVPSQISIMIVPGIGFRVGDHMLQLDKVDQILVKVCAVGHLRRRAAI